jgi:hypothetical protein
MTATASTNAKPPRKQLADQLDRLDAILDTLANGLNQAVADAAREGHQAAMKEVLLEVLADPDVQRKLSTPNPGAAVAVRPARQPRKSRPWTRLGVRVRTAAGAIRQKAAWAVRGMAAWYRANVSSISLRKVVPAALGIGVSIALLCLLLPHPVAAAIAGFGAAGVWAALLIAHSLWKADR